MSRELHDALRRRKEITGEGPSTFVERVIRAELGMSRLIPKEAATREPREPKRPEPKKPDPTMADARVELRRRMTERRADPKLARAKAAALERSKIPEAVREERLMANPCRLPGCNREGLHEAHDDRPSLFNGSRGPLSRVGEADPYVDHLEGA